MDYLTKKTGNLRAKDRHKMVSYFFAVPKWIFFIKEAENLTVIPENLDDEGLKEAYHDANKHSWKKEELEAYDYAAMREQDERGKLVHAKREGKTDVAKEMKKDGEPIHKIMKYTGLTEEEINEI